MTVTFGRIGTTRLSGGARLVCTPDSQIAAPPAPPADVTPNAVNWTDITGEAVGTTNTQTISGINTSITLRIESDYNGNGQFNIYINDVMYAMADNFANDGYSDHVVSNGDQIYFERVTTAGALESTTVKNLSDGNAIIDTFEISLSGGA